jgi:hypothetical protein
MSAGSDIQTGSLDWLANSKDDSTHPVIAQDEMHNAAISKYFPVPGSALNILDRLSKQGES